MADLPGGKHNVDFFLRGPGSSDNDVHHGGEVDITAPWLPLTFSMGPFDVPVPASGDIVAFISIDGGPLEKIGALNVAPPLR
ncbi:MULTISPECIES: hypothetical protein [unclassified Rhizobium]|nr:MULTISPECIES: hypothetical protein [unclassified Rhizobium]MBD9447168.1 hypothetical protein [Rhizobium sp. RHZ01]